MLAHRTEEHGTGQLQPPSRARKSLRRAELASLRRLLASAWPSLRNGDSSCRLLAEMASALGEGQVVSRATLIAIFCQERTLQTKRGVAALRQQQSGALVRKLAEERYVVAQAQGQQQRRPATSAGGCIVERALEWGVPPCAFMRVLIVDGLGFDRKMFGQWLKCPELVEARLAERKAGHGNRGEGERVWCLLV